MLSPASHMAALSGNNDDGDGVSDDVVSVAAAECIESSASSLFEEVSARGGHIQAP